MKVARANTFLPSPPITHTAIWILGLESKQPFCHTGNPRPGNWRATVRSGPVCSTDRESQRRTIWGKSGQEPARVLPRLIKTTDGNFVRNFVAPKAPQLMSLHTLLVLCPTPASGEPGWINHRLSCSACGFAGHRLVGQSGGQLARLKMTKW
jgi:hypothetical protein